MVSDEKSLATLTEIDKMIMALPAISTIPDARRLLALAQGYVTTAQKLYKGNISDITTINDANDDKGKAYDIAKRAGELRLYTEARLGELIRLEQEIGRLASPGDNQYSGSNNYVTTLKDYGLTKMESSRAQELAEHKDIIARVIVESLDIPTRNAVLGEIKKQRHEGRKSANTEATMPDGLFDILVIDPPWPYGGSYNPFGHRVQSPYREKTIEEIMMLDIPSAEDCILWLWTTNRFMHDAYHILEVWGFEPKSILTWFKGKIGTGYWLRGETEHCLLAIKGHPQIQDHSQSTHLKAIAGQHSAKPDEFYQLVETLCSGRKLDIFGRKERKGWAVYGDQRMDTTLSE